MDMTVELGVFTDQRVPAFALVVQLPPAGFTDKNSLYEVRALGQQLRKAQLQPVCRSTSTCKHLFFTDWSTEPALCRGPAGVQPGGLLSSPSCILCSLLSVAPACLSLLALRGKSELFL